MKIKQYQVDAFASRVFEGNPAAICPLEYWLDDVLLQCIAAENNLSETAFFVPVANGWQLRWFTPLAEVDLCGHATLAAAHVLYEHMGYANNTITFFTRSGELVVSKRGALLDMEFPASNPLPCLAIDDLVAGVGGAPVEILAAEDYMVVYASEQEVRNITPNHVLLEKLGLRGVIVTAPGDHIDFVSRFFAPRLGINEDPVTGSAHCQLAPYWARKLGKNNLVARQVSQRGGAVNCEVKTDKVILTGQAVTFMQGDIEF